MNKFIILSAVAAILAGCADSVDTVTDPTDPDDGDVTVTNGTVSLGDLNGATYTPGANTLFVTIALDGNQVVQEYDEDGMIGTYTRFTQQLDPDNDREFTGVAKQSSDGQVQAVAVSDGGQFNRFYGGNFATQNSFTAPDSGIVNYQGDYVGLLNFGPAAGGGVGDSDSSIPNSAGVVTGQVFFKADFSDNVVNGAIYDREFETTELPEIVLVAGDIDANGGFTGGTELLDLTNVGQYAGVFGGNGTSVAGVVRLTAGFLGEDFFADPEDGGNEVEHGIFVLDAD